MSDTVVIGSFAKNGREACRVALVKFKGLDLIDLRVTVDLTRTSGVQTPTKKGISIGVRHIDALVDLLTKARAEAATLGLLPGGDA